AWIEAGSTEVTCAYAAGAGLHPEPAAPCTKLTTLACPPPATTCDDTQLAYTMYKDGWRVTCKTGTLVTDVTPTGDAPVADCTGGASFFTANGNMANQANCVTDESIVQSCIDLVPGGTGLSTMVSCKLGACTFTCKNGLQFNYIIQGE
ncbi:hypothetical protein PMAYCL1PPCAC_25760, partial [Pristionchus mayeri]